jgi:hypothetical protein
MTSMLDAQVADGISPRIVRYHPPFGLSTLFRSLPKIGIRPPLDVSYTAAKSNVTLRFSAKEALGIPEQTLLLVLLELAQEALARPSNAARLNRHVAEKSSKALWTTLNRGFLDQPEESVRFTTTWYELSERSGASTGGMSQRLRREQLQRLCEVVVWQEGRDARQTTRQSYLVSWLIGDDTRVHVALNARLAVSLLDGQFAAVSLAERMRLPSDAAKALHAFFSTCLRPGRGIKVSVASLVSRLWPESEVSAPAGTLRRRHKDIRDALKELNTLAGWAVSDVGRDIVEVRHLKPSVRETTTPRRKANIPMLERERLDMQEARKSAASEALDASGLFLN